MNQPGRDERIVGMQTAGCGRQRADCGASKARMDRAKAGSPEVTFLLRGLSSRQPCTGQTDAMGDDTRPTDAISIGSASLTLTLGRRSYANHTPYTPRYQPFKPFKG